MWHNRRLWAVFSIVMGGVQALDSGVMSSGSVAQLLTALGIAASALALAVSEKWTAWVVALASGAVLLTIARIVSPVSLNTLHLGLMVPALYVFFVCRWEEIAAGTKA